MTDRAIRRIVIVGGGSAGWMTAAAISNVCREDREITLVESEDIKIVGVGEATVPQVRSFNNILGLDEAEFLKATQGTFKLAIQFKDWTRPGSDYLHPFGVFGVPFDAVPMHQYWLRARNKGVPTSIEEYSMGCMAARLNRFDKPIPDPRRVRSLYDYAYHFDAILYAKYLRGYSEQRGVKRVEGRVVDVKLRGEDGFIESIKLEDGREIAGEFFVDCSGFRGLLIEGALKTGYEDWTRWLPCNRAVAGNSSLGGELTPFTRATAREAGWQWRIPLQHRIGTGYVYSSEHISDDEATSVLLNNLDGEFMGEPRLLRFTTGRRSKFWNRNCIAIGLAAGFMEPLESSSLYVAQTGILRLLAYFPDLDFDPLVIDKYNEITTREYERIRNFLVLHYHTSGRPEPLWQACRSMSIPDELASRLEHYRKYGRLVYDLDELFQSTSWLAVLNGQEVRPERIDPVLSYRASVDEGPPMNELRTAIRKAAEAMPKHADYIARYCRAEPENAFG